MGDQKYDKKQKEAVVLGGVESMRSESTTLGGSSVVLAHHNATATRGLSESVC